MSEWLATLLVVLVLAACATPAAPTLTPVTILEWTRTVDKTGEPTHYVQIEYRSRKDGAYVREKFESSQYLKLHSSFYACIDEGQPVHELAPCD